MARTIGLQILRGVAANIPTLLIGELYLTTDTHQLYIGTSGGNQSISSSGSSNAVQGTVNFGQLEPTEDTTARVTVAASWVTSSSIITATVVEGANHTDDEIAAEQVSATIGNIIPGVSFDVVLSSPNGSSGTFLVNIVS